MPLNASHGVPAAELLQRLRRLRSGHRRSPAPAVVVHQPGEVGRARLAVEVPGRVRGDDRAAERVAAERRRVPPARLGRLDHAAQVLHGDPHAPLAREADRGVGNRLQVRLDRRVGQEAEVVVEDGLRRGRARLGAVEDRLVLQEVLAPLDRPDLPARARGRRATWRTARSRRCPPRCPARARGRSSRGAEPT